MKILSIDTASNICGVSITENEKLLCQLDENTGRTHSEKLMPMISKAFDMTNLHINNIGLIVCDIGPGSFTGIRIGIATVKAFHDSLQIPCIGVNSLECLAYNVKLCESTKKFCLNEYTICSLIDCKNENCYFALYKFVNNNYTCIIEPSSDNIQNILKLLESYSNIIFVGDGALLYKDLIISTSSKYQILPNEENNLNSYSLCLAGLENYAHYGNTDIIPLYLKKPQAQQQLESRRSLN